MTTTAVKLALESSLEWAELALTINGEDPDPVIRIQTFSQGAPIGWVRSILSSQESIRLPRALLSSIVSLVGVKSDESKAYIALAVDLDNDVEVTITAVDESGGADPGGGGTQARIAGTVTIDGTPASRDIVVISDDPSGRQVIAQGQSAGDGTFDITYNDWAGAVIALALDEYGDEFTPETALNMGQVVHPETPNGYVYQVTAAGTTGTEEPTWSTSGSVTSGSVTFNALPYYRPVASGPLDSEVLSAHPYQIAVEGSEPVAYYRLENESGTVLVAEVGQDGEVAGPANLAQPGLISEGAAIQLTASSYLQAPNPVLAADSTFSVEMLVSSLTGGDSQSCLACDKRGSGYNWIVGYSPEVVGAGQIRIYYGSGGNNVTLPGPIADGEPHHVVVLFDKAHATENVRVYVDGAKTGYAQRALNIGQNAEIFFGSWQQTLTGIYDEIAVYDRALSDAEITDHFNACGIGQA